MDQLISSEENKSNQAPIAKAADRLDDYLENLLRSKYTVTKMIPVIQAMVSSKLLSVNQFPLAEKGYSRTILYRGSCGFEIMIARWSKMAKTPIHGHPGFALIYVIEGQFEEESYVKNSEEIVSAGQHQLSSGAFAFDGGVEGRFDNSIHQITAVTEGLSLHIYSDDALKGEIYSI